MTPGRILHLRPVRSPEERETLARVACNDFSDLVPGGLAEKYLVRAGVPVQPEGASEEDAEEESVARRTNVEKIAPRRPHEIVPMRGDHVDAIDGEKSGLMAGQNHLAHLQDEEDSEDALLEGEPEGEGEEAEGEVLSPDRRKTGKISNFVRNMNQMMFDTNPRPDRRLSGNTTAGSLLGAAAGLAPATVRRQMLSGVNVRRDDRVKSSKCLEVQPRVEESDRVCLEGPGQSVVHLFQSRTFFSTVD